MLLGDALKDTHQPGKARRVIRVRSTHDSSSVPPQVSSQAAHAAFLLPIGFACTRLPNGGKFMIRRYAAKITDGFLACQIKTSNAFLDRLA
jgi:hypothetical protein